MKKKGEDRQTRWKQKHPWVRFVEYARRRCACTDPEKWWPFYGMRGITCDLTAVQLRVAWFRDGADKMEKPSIDRIDPDGNYTFDNVRFLEFKLNARFAWDPTAKAEYDAVVPGCV